MVTILDDLVRFWAKVLITDGGCWQWQANLVQGYGHFSVRTRTHKAHRWAYKFFVGPIPEGLHLDHLCRNPACCNPAHLEPVTPRENTMRSDNIIAHHAHKTHCHRGHPFSSENTKPVKRGGVIAGRSCRVCNGLKRRERHAWRMTHEPEYRERMRQRDQDRWPRRRLTKPFPRGV